MINITRWLLAAAIVLTCSVEVDARCSGNCKERIRAERQLEDEARKQVEREQDARHAEVTRNLPHVKCLRGPKTCRPGPFASYGAPADLSREVDALRDELDQLKRRLQ